MNEKACPKCGSRQLLYLPWLGQIWTCKKCGYRGPLFIELSERALWAALRRIPKGKVTTYKRLAESLGMPVRAVPALLRRNPKPPLIPCHRVVHTDGRLGGYAFGGARKKALLLKKEGVAIEKGRIDLKKHLQRHDNQ